jgi:hypothetical protein
MLGCARACVCAKTNDEPHSADALEQLLEDLIASSYPGPLPEKLGEDEDIVLDMPVRWTRKQWLRYVRQPDTVLQ